MCSERICLSLTIVLSIDCLNFRTTKSEDSVHSLKKKTNDSLKIQ